MLSQNWLSSPSCRELSWPSSSHKTAPCIGRSTLAITTIQPSVVPQVALVARPSRAFPEGYSRLCRPVCPGRAGFDREVPADVRGTLALIAIIGRWFQKQKQPRLSRTVHGHRMTRGGGCVQSKQRRSGCTVHNIRVGFSTQRRTDCSVGS